MRKALHIAASPNAERDDVKIAFKKLLSPWTWGDQRHSNELKAKIGKYFGSENVCLYDSGRSAITEILKAFKIGPGDEVLVHSFTCLVVVNPILWVGAKPVFVDVDPTNYNFDLEDLKKKITSKTKAVIVQHTFGIPEDIDSLRKIVGSKVFIIEDLAHCVGAEYKGKKLGTFGDASILTFGIEKVISSVRGGAGIIYNKEYGKWLLSNQENLPEFPRFFTAIGLYNPIFWYLTKPVYYFGIGKITLGRIKIFLGHMLNILGRMIEDVEYKGTKPKWFPAKISPALSSLGVNQWNKLENFNKHREEIKNIYEKELKIKYENTTSMLRFPIIVNERSKLIKEMSKIGVVLGDWYKKILYTPEKNLSYFGYTIGMCPNAEKIIGSVVNLPTFIHVSKEDAEKIAKTIKPFIKAI